MLTVYLYAQMHLYAHTLICTDAYEAVAWHFLETRSSQVVQGWLATEDIGTVLAMGPALQGLPHWTREGKTFSFDFGPGRDNCVPGAVR